MTPCGVSVEASAAKSASRTDDHAQFQTLHMRLDRTGHRLRDDHGADFGVALQRFFEQMKAFGDGESIVGERAFLHRAAHLF